MDNKRLLPIIQVGDVLLSPDILTEQFCCDYEKCKGVCCVEGDAGAPVTIDEVMELENALDAVWDDLSASAQAEIDKHGVAYNDRDGDLVTSIVGGKDCVFTCYEGDSCLCAVERACRQGRCSFVKPISCALYPIREKRLSNGLVALNYHQWEVCKDARALGRKLNMPVWKFLREPLVRRFGQEWYDELTLTAEALDNEAWTDGEAE